MSKRRNWVRLVVVGVLLAVIATAALAVLGIQKLLHSEGGRKLGKTLELTVNSMKGPGPAALQAAGCETAMVLDSATAWSILGPSGKKEQQAPGSSSAPKPSGTLISCYVTGEETTLDCGTLVGVLHEAAPEAKEPFTITVGRTGGPPICSGTYSADGKTWRR